MVVLAGAMEHEPAAITWIDGPRAGKRLLSSAIRHEKLMEAVLEVGTLPPLLDP